MISIRLPLCLILGLVLAGPAEARFNVLLIISDDLNTDIRTYGDSQAVTPHLDRLAETAIRFERAYCNFPVCNPSRASMLTGRLPDTTRVLNNSAHFRKALPDVVTLPQLFRKAGYYVARVGKVYHHGIDRDERKNGGLDDPPSWEHVVNPSGRDRGVDEEKIFSLVPGNFGGALSWLSADGADDEHTDGMGAAATIALMEERKEDGRPFFIATGFFRPHTPFVAPHPYFERYPLDDMELVEPQADFSNVPEAALMSANPREQAMDEETQRRAIQAYHASVSFVDAQVGRLLDALDRLGLSENTVVLFTSDHGYLLGDHGLWKKKNLFERAARVPLYVRMPGIEQGGKTANCIVELLDIYPTLAELCDLTPPDELDGKSFVPVLRDPSGRHREGAFTEMVRNIPRDGKRVEFAGYSIRTDRYRYTEWDGGKEGVELYDYDADPREFTNLAGDPAHAATVQELKAMLHVRIGQ